LNTVLDGLLLLFMVLRKGFVFSTLMKVIKRNSNLTPISREEHQSLYQVMEHFAKQFNIPDAPLYLRKSLNDIIDGSAGFGRVYLTRRFLESYPEHPEIADFIIGHEMAHLLFKDYGWKVQKNFLLCLFSHEARMSNILVEIRADICSAIYGTLTEEEYIRAHKLMEKTNGGEDKIQNYKVGYPTRDERIHYSKVCMELHRNKCLDRDSFSQHVIKPLLESYCDEFGIRKNQQRENYLQKVDAWFWNDCHERFLK
jgi:hypothetical protein